VLAAVGQSVLMHLYDTLFAERNIVVAQALLTRDDLRHRVGYLNARNTLLALLAHRVLPIINENDVVAVEELRIGDNDTLSAMVAGAVDADVLVLLTDTGGLYTADPRRDPDAALLPLVERIDRGIEALAGGAGTAQGSGGMRTKVQAARLAAAAGIETIIGPGTAPDVVLRVLTGERLGTRFLAAASRQQARRRWILSALGHGAAVQVDEGAAAALLRRGRSLLPAGVRAVSGRFRRGDPVSVLDPAGRQIACGLSNYSSEDVARIQGCHSEQIEGLLGYAYGDEVIHRDNLVLLEVPGDEPAGPSSASL